MEPRQVEPNLVQGRTQFAKKKLSHVLMPFSFPSHFSVQSVVESFFTDSLLDARFTSSDLHSFPSTHAIVTDPISFNLPALKSGSVYR